MDDVCASSLQPSVVPAAEDLQQPLEAQGRGFAHGHIKGHSLPVYRRYIICVREFNVVVSIVKESRGLL